MERGGGVLGLSFDGSGIVGGVDSDDEDVLLFDPSGPTWTLGFQTSTEATHVGGFAEV